MDCLWDCEKLVDETDRWDELAHLHIFDAAKVETEMSRQQLTSIRGFILV